VYGGSEEDGWREASVTRMNKEEEIRKNL
jgi:hypothetical protein